MPWQNPDYQIWNKGKTVSEDPRIQSSTVNIRTAISAQHPSPSGLENRIFSLLMINDLPYDFVGDTRSSSIGGRFPDFIHHTQKIVLEIADKHEKEFRKDVTWQQYQDATIAHYSVFGYQCFVLWSDMTDEQIVDILRSKTSNIQTLPSPQE